jgi:hypothetical protein
MAVRFKRAKGCSRDRFPLLAILAGVLIIVPDKYLSRIEDRLWIGESAASQSAIRAEISMGARELIAELVLEPDGLTERPGWQPRDVRCCAALTDFLYDVTLGNTFEDPTFVELMTNQPHAHVLDDRTTTVRSHNASR